MAIKFLNTVAVDTNVLYVDAINNRVGIGTTSPSEKLHVVGNAFLSANSAFKASYNNTDSYHGSMRWAGLQLGNNGVNKIVAGRTAAGGSFQFWTNNTNDAANYTVTADGIMTMAMTNAGNVGIGTTSPIAKLHVEGDKTYSLGYLDKTSDLHIGNDTMSSAVGAYAGSITFGSTNESNLQAASIVAVQTDTDPNEIGLAFFTQHSSAGSADLVESMRIKNDGNVGIGTTAPGAKLEINSGGGVHISDDAAGRTLIIKPSLSGAVHEFTSDNTAAGYSFSNNSSELMRITNGGNVGIGTTNPTGKLDVFRTSTNYAVNLSDTLSRSGLVVKSSGAFDSKITFSSGASSRQYIQALNNAATTGRDISINPYGGNVGIGTDAPTSGVGSTRILKVSSNGNSEVNVDHTDGGTSSDIGLFSFSRNGDHLAHMKATHDGATNSAFMSFHAQPAGGSFSNASSNERMRITSIGRVGIGTTSPNTKLDVISGTNGGIRISATDTTSNWRDIDIRSYVSQAQANALPDGSAIFTTNPSSQTETAFSKYGGTVIQGRDDGNSSFAIRLGNGGGYATRMFMGATGETTFSNTVQASGYKSSDGSAGITGTMTFVDHGSVTRTITYKNGLVVATS